MKGSVMLQLLVRAYAFADACFAFSTYTFNL